MERISTMEVRQRIGDLLNRVALRHDEFIIERKGKPLAALVPVERLEQLQKIARQAIAETLGRQHKYPGGKLDENAAMSVAVEAQAAARRPRTKRSASRSKPAKKA